MASQQFDKLKKLQKKLKMTIKKDDVSVNKFKILSLRKKVNNNNVKKVNILSNVVLNTRCELVTSPNKNLTTGKEPEQSILYQMLNPSECNNEQLMETGDVIMVQDMSTYPSGLQSEQQTIHLGEPIQLDMGTEMLDSIIQQPRRPIGGKNMDVLQTIMDDLGQIDNQVPAEDSQVAVEISPLDIDSPKSMVNNMLENITMMRQKFSEEQASVAKTVAFLEDNLQSCRERLGALSHEVEYLNNLYNSISKVA